jgi:ribosomal protein L14
VALLSAQGQPLGTRLFGPVLEEMRRAKGLKLVSLASTLV